MTTFGANQKEEYAKSVCMFLGEMLRTRRISLARSAEIAQKVVQNLNLIDSEKDFLRFIKELTSDFEELFKLEKIVELDVQVSERKQMEDRVREFAIGIMAENANLALQVLTEAIKDGVKFEDLIAKFPQLKQITTT